jgi:hypothetical protein
MYQGVKNAISKLCENVFCIEKENPGKSGFSFLRIWKFHKQTKFLLKGLYLSSHTL